MKKKSSNKKTLTTKKATKKVVTKKPTAKKSVKKVTTKKKVVTKRTTKPPTKKTVVRTTRPQAISLTLSDEQKNLLAQHQTLKLQIELVPSSCWYSNVRSLKNSQWDKIRKASYAKANYHCEICGGQGTKHPVECHEVWIYEEETLTQRLSFFQSICPLCHEVKHIGLAGVLGNSERAFNRFRDMNNLDETTAKKIKSAVFTQWQIRNKQNWKLDITHLKEYGIDITELEDRSNLKRQTFA